MLIKEIVTEMAEELLPKLSTQIRNIFNPLNIRVDVRKHFILRSTDGNIDKHNNPRGDLIVYEEVIDTISKFAEEYAIYLNRKQHWGGIIRSDQYDLNIVFRMQTHHYPENKRGKRMVKTIEFITIMKHDNFKAGTLKFLHV